MIMGAFCIPVFILGILGYKFELDLYGYHTQAPLSATGTLLFILFLLKGVVAYSLWFEKRWAVFLGIVDAAVGILICVISMANISILPNSGGFRLEIVFLIPYLIKLSRIKKKWIRLGNG